MYYVAACNQAGLGVASIFGPQSQTLASHINSMCNTLEIPYIEVSTVNIIFTEYSLKYNILSWNRGSVLQNCTFLLAWLGAMHIWSYLCQFNANVTI